MKGPRILVAVIIMATMFTCSPATAQGTSAPRGTETVIAEEGCR